MTSPVRMSCRPQQLRQACIGSTQTCLRTTRGRFRNMWVCLSLFLYLAGRRGPLDMWRHWSHGTHGGSRAVPCREAESGAVRYVAMSEPPRRGTEPWDAWQHWSPPQYEGRVQSHETRGSIKALFNSETGPKPCNTWQRPPQHGDRVQNWRTRGGSW
jgi:hypothetical protein